MISPGTTANRKSTVVLDGYEYTLSLLSLALRFCPPNLLVVLSLVHPFHELIRISQLVLGILLDSRTYRLLLVLGWAQVPGRPNQIEGKDLHFLSLLDLIKETAILLLAVTVSYFMTMKEDSRRMSLMLRTAKQKETEYLGP